MMKDSMIDLEMIGIYTWIAHFIKQMQHSGRCMNTVIINFTAEKTYTEKLHQLPCRVNAYAYSNYTQYLISLPDDNSDSYMSLHIK